MSCVDVDGFVGCGVWVDCVDYFVDVYSQFDGFYGVSVVEFLCDFDEFEFVVWVLLVVGFLVMCFGVGLVVGM